MDTKTRDLFDIQKSYWYNCGKYEVLGNRLDSLIPRSGEVPDAKSSPKLEMYRKARNCYHDLYNNGLCNRAAEFYRVFNIPSSKHKMHNGDFHPRMYQLVEAKMDEIILEAGIEQGFI